jgi:AcrR family transcriptional regulator
VVKPGRDPRAELVEAGARVLAQEGPGALSARSLARAAGTSTMAVYTHFGGMPAVVRAIIHEGFARLAAELARVPATDDPVADCAALALAYRRAAHRAPHLYRVMFGATGFELSAEDRAVGAYTLRVARDAMVRCIETGRFLPAEPWELTRQSWCLVHGLVSLELAGFFPNRTTGVARGEAPGPADGVAQGEAPGPADGVAQGEAPGPAGGRVGGEGDLGRFLVGFASGAGDLPDRAVASVGRALRESELQQLDGDGGDVAGGQ